MNEHFRIIHEKAKVEGVRMEPKKRDEEEERGKSKVVRGERRGTKGQSYFGFSLSDRA